VTYLRKTTNVLLLLAAALALSCGDGAGGKNNGPIVITDDGNGGSNGSPANSGSNGSPANSLPNGSPNNVVSEHPDESLLRGIVGLGSLLADDVDTMLNNAVEAVWFASEQMGTPTMTGTITQQGQAYTYTPGPSDRLVIKASGATVEVRVQSMDGYTEGTWEDFTESHDMDFTITVQDVLDLRITSASRYQDCDDPAYTTCYGWDRTVKGFIMSEADRIDLNFTDSGVTKYSVDGDFSLYKTGRKTKGTAQTPTGAIQMDEGSSAQLTHNRISAQQVRNFSIGTSSTGSTDNGTYAAQDIVVYWEDVNSMTQEATPLVNEPDYWEARGTITRDGELFGSVAFDDAVVKGTDGPRVVLQLVDGSTIVLFKPIEGP
jgi:hypothetical protein